jgi:hypothetical protein
MLGFRFYLRYRNRERRKARGAGRLEGNHRESGVFGEDKGIGGQPKMASLVT